MHEQAKSYLSIIEAKRKSPVPVPLFLTKHSCRGRIIRHSSYKKSSNLEIFPSENRIELLMQIVIAELKVRTIVDVANLSVLLHTSAFASSWADSMVAL